MRAEPRKGLHTIEVLAFWTNHPKETLRTWAKRGRITPIACDVKSRSNLYDGLAVVEQVGIKPERRLDNA